VQGRGRPKNSGGVPLISEIGLTHDQSKEYGKLSDADDPVSDAAVEITVRCERRPRQDLRTRAGDREKLA
jgi:hypothetical protein